MAEEAPRTTLSLHKESRLDFAAGAEECLIQIQIPSTGTFSRAARNQRRVLKQAETPRDEKTFQRTQLAASSSVFRGSSAQYPRTLLWRLLDEDKVLEIRPIDLIKDGEENDTLCVIQLRFPSPIHREAVTLVDDTNDIVEVYTLTKGHDLYTVSLRSSFFQHEKASEINVERWCKSYRPASFTMCTPHRLIAADSKQVLISLSDGRLMRLTRKEGENGTQWQERTFNDGQWGSSLRGLVRWQGNNTIRYDGSTLDQATALAGELSPDGRHVHTVCMNHTLKVWELETGKCVFARDLLGFRREPKELPELMLDPASTNLLRMFTVNGAVEGDEYYLMTYSPQDVGQFKFWAVRDADAGDKGIRDLYPDETLRPVDPELNPDSKAVWRVGDFGLGFTEKSNRMDIWMLMKSNRRYRVFHLAFDLGYFPNSLPSDWQTSWTTVAQETLNDQSEPRLVGNESEDVTDRWVNFLFYPGKHSTSVLELALSVYQSSRNWIPQSKAKISLQERLCHAISSDIKLERFKDNVDPHRQYRLALHQEWLILWQDVQDVERQLWEATSLAYDDQQDMSWLTFTGGCAAIRSCDQIERMAQNLPEDLAKSGNLLPLPSVEDGQPQEIARFPDELAVLIDAAAGFRESFSTALRYSCQDTLSLELWQEPTLSIPDRLQTFYEQCHFESEVSDDAFEGLNEALVPIGGFNGLENGYFDAILRALPATMAPAPSGLIWTQFGSKIFERATRECIHLQRQLVLDLLLLVVFLTVEVDEEGNPLASIDSALIYSLLLERAKEYEIMHWLSTHSRTQPSSDPQDPSTSPAITILESLFSQDISPQECVSQPQSEALTNTVGDVLTYINGRSQDAPFDEAILMVQCDLLAKGNLDLAADFAKFMPCSAWGTYVKGRMCLMQGKIEEADLAFKKAAWKLSRPSNFNYLDASVGLLPTHFDSFGHGLSRYYTHIAFLPSLPPTQVASFASLALQSHTHNSTGDNDNHRSSLLKTLFTASIQTDQFDSAFSALTRLPTHDARELIPDLVDAMISADSFPRLFTYPWLPRLGDVVDSHLAGKAATYTPPTPSSSSSFFTALKKPAIPGPSSQASSSMNTLFPRSQPLHPLPLLDSPSQPPPPNYPHLLASYRISRSDHRGAAAMLITYLLRLQKLEKSLQRRRKQSRASPSFPSSPSSRSGTIEQGKAQARKLLFAHRQHPEMQSNHPTKNQNQNQNQKKKKKKKKKKDLLQSGESDVDLFWETHIEPTFLFAINSLLCAGDSEDEQWVFVGGGGGGDGGHGTSSTNGTDGSVGGDEKGKKTMGQGERREKDGKRRIVTLKDMREWYHEELDRRSVIERGRWGFGAAAADDDGDDDDDDDSEEDGDEQEDEQDEQERERDEEDVSMDLA